MSGVPVGSAPAVPATTTVPSGTATPNPVVTGEGTVVSAPDRITTLTRAVILTGTTLPPDDGGLTHIRTASGEVVLRLPDPLPADQSVSLQVSPGKPPRVSLAVTSPTQSRTGTDTRTGATGSAAPDATTLTRITGGMDGATATASVATVLPQGLVLPAMVLSVAAPTTRGVGETRGEAAKTTDAETGRDEEDSGSDEIDSVKPRAGGRVESKPRPAPAPTPTPRGGRTEGAPERIAASPSGALGPATAPEPPAPMEKAAAPVFGAPTPAAPVNAAPSPAAASVPSPGVTAKPELDATPKTDAAPTPPSRLDSKAAPDREGASTEPPAPTRPETPTAPPPKDGAPRRANAPRDEPTRGETPRPKAETSAPSEPEPSPETENAENADPKTAPAAPPRPTPRREPILTKGAIVAVRVVETAPPSSDSELPVPPAPTGGDEPMLSGTVAGATPDGRAVLATSAGNLALEIRPAPERGSRVVVALVDPAARSPAQLAPLDETDVDDLTRLATTGRDWPALRALIATLAGFDPPVARGLVTSVIPKPDKRMGSTLLFLLSAARGGDARGWLGEEAVDGLTKAGATGILARFEREFGEGRRETVDQNGAEWRTLCLPMLDASGVRQMRIHVHERSEEERNEDKGEPGERERRFLLDIDLTRLGAMQLDGLVRARRFDLILRSAAALADPLRNELIRTFAASVESVGFSGGLSFQVGARAFVVPRPKGTAGAGVTA